MQNPSRRLIAPLATLTFLCTIAYAQPVAAQEFSWGNVQNHPSGIPDGNYLTKNENQMDRCNGGCVLYSTVGAMEIQFKIQEANPSLTLDLDEDHFLDLRDIQNDGDGDGQLCQGNCDATIGFSPPYGSPDCVPTVLQSEGLRRTGDTSTGITYTIGSYTPLTTASHNFDSLRDLIDVGPVVAGVWVEGDGNVECSDPGLCSNDGCMGHKIIFVGYGSRINPNTGVGIPQVQIKNSWGTNNYGYSEYEWVDWDAICLISGDIWWMIDAVGASDDTTDSDGDSIPDYRDLCPNWFSYNQRNLDNDAQGDACDDDLDNDHIDNVSDCHPLNKYLGVDADLDGACDDDAAAVDGNGNPFAYWLRTVPLRDYLDLGTSSENSGPSNLTPDQICMGECTRISGLPGAQLPLGFDLTDCEDLCDRTVTPRDTCSPLSQSLGHFECEQSARSVRFDDFALDPQDLITCQRYWYNPGAGQIDSDGDGVGDFCDTEPRLVNFTMYVDSHPNGAFECYDDFYKIEFNTWGGREEDQTSWSGFSTRASVDGCFCPGATTWDADCEQYCPSSGELPTSQDPNWNPGASNAAWDPITDPYRCMSKTDIDNGLPHHLCIDRHLHIMGYSIENQKTKKYGWYWQPFYDSDQVSSGLYAEHPSMANDVNPGLAKVRVAWSRENLGDTPASTVVLPVPSRMRRGCFLVPFDVGGLHIDQHWWIPPAPLVEFVRPSLPAGVISDFDQVSQPTAALALAGDQVVAMDAAGGAIIGVSPAQATDQAAFEAAAAVKSATSGYLNLELAQGIATGVYGRADFSTQTPVVYYLKDNTLWLGLLAFENRWVTWEEAFGTGLPAMTRIAQVAFDPVKPEVLVMGVRPDDGGDSIWSVMGFDLETSSWVERWRAEGASTMDAGVDGFKLLSDLRGRHLYLVGGEGSNWSALVHRIDRLSRELVPIQTGAEEATVAYRNHGLGAFMGRNDLYVAAGDTVVKVGLSSAPPAAEVVTLPEGVDAGEAPYIYVEGAKQDVTIIPKGSPFDTARIQRRWTDSDSEWTASPVFESVSEEPTGADGEISRDGSLTVGQSEVVLFHVTEDTVGVHYRARLLDPTGLLRLRMFDENGELMQLDDTDGVEKILQFVPASDHQYYVLNVSPSFRMEPGTQVNFALLIEIDPEHLDQSDSGCGCHPPGSSTNPAVFLLIGLILLGLAYQRRRKK